MPGDPVTGMISVCPPTIVVSVVLPAVVPGAVPVFLLAVCVLAVFATELLDGVDAVALEPPLGGAVVTCDEPPPHAVVTSAKTLAAVNNTNRGLLPRTVQAYATRFSRAQTCPAARSGRRS